MLALAPDRANLMVTLLPALKTEEPSGLMGWRTPLHWYCTQTTNVLVVVLPAASVAVQVTVVLPGAKVEPEAGEQVTGTVPSTLSVAVAVKVTTAPAVLLA